MTLIETATRWAVELDKGRSVEDVVALFHAVATRNLKPGLSWLLERCYRFAQFGRSEGSSSPDF